MGCAHSAPPPHQAPAFHICGRYRARIIAVHDGIRLTAVLRYKGSWYSVRIRLSGISVPALIPSRRHSGGQVARAKLARDSVRHRVLQREVWLTCGAFDATGCVLSKVQVANQDLGDWMLSTQLGSADATTRIEPS